MKKSKVVIEPFSEKYEIKKINKKTCTARITIHNFQNNRKVVLFHSCHCFFVRVLKLSGFLLTFIGYLTLTKVMLILQLYFTDFGIKICGRLRNFFQHLFIKTGNYFRESGFLNGKCYNVTIKETKTFKMVSACGGRIWN